MVSEMKSFAVIFDLNGTLVDTEVAYFLAYKDVFSKYNIPFTIEEFTMYWSTQGKKLSDYLKIIKREDLMPKEKEMLKEKDIIFQETLEQRAKLMPGAKDVVDNIKREDIKLGLDSSTTRGNIDKMLLIFKLNSYFDAVASGDMDLDEQKYGEKKKKSSRLKATADLLGFLHSRCVVIGDAQKDIQGAKKAGMTAIAIPNQYTKDNDFSQADKIIKSLNEITPEVLNSLI